MTTLEHALDAYRSADALVQRNKAAGRLTVGSNEAELIAFGTAYRLAEQLSDSDRAIFSATVDDWSARGVPSVRAVPATS